MDDLIWALLGADALMIAYIIALALGWLIFMLMCILYIGQTWNEIEDLCEGEL